MKNNNTHEFFMNIALKEAKKALKIGEVPIGAIVVDENNKIIGKGYNKAEKTGCQTAHAEIIAIKQACKKKGNWRLEGCTIYVTLEPCLMCFGLIALSRMKSIFYGAKSPLFGAGLDNMSNFPVYNKELFSISNLNTAESIFLLQQFFKERRKKGPDNGASF
ncbi:TPA: tRNA-specific adenosine deaminase [Candidatus Dependentiae bacterium]|nr:MAG: CMP/dCMP deaminase zinc-binding protein [candidate division TM6 bacterium GW2011_GWE2_31_21]KKP54111.1 MAG: CMP/dCMP deaminase zinc-binding protein [candidate division TM6 bacterium GW2011_GWF2_33_332]HBS48307.1 tRNA-specific adenosine deaminase [Candidatus Dependentiae bacterium]HBZ73019.1 tRNA-specific adenosine deaminase [Candidatus Dependentiae bacterium]